MRRILLSCLWLIGSLYTLTAAAVEVSAQPTVYISIDDSYQSEQARLQYGADLRTGLLFPLTDAIALSAQLGLGCVAPSQVYGSSFLRGYTSISLGLGVDYAISSRMGLRAEADALYSTYIGTYIRFAHIGITCSPYYTIFEDRWRIILEMPIRYDLRRDIDHTVSAGLGVRVLLPLGRARR